MSESAEPYKEFIREMTLRIERAMRELARESREDRRIVLAEMRATHRDIREEIRDLRDESIVQREALLALIDRLRGNGPEPAT